MRISSPDAEGTHRRPPGCCTRFPFCKLGLHIERAGLEVDDRIGLGKMERRRNLLVLQAQNSLDQSGDTGSGVQVSNIAFDRTDRTEAIALRVGAKRLRKRLYLDWISQR